MCSYKILYHQSAGYVVKCNSCENYQIAFGTMVFTISTENITSLFGQVEKLHARKELHTCERERFQVKLPCDSVIMALNKKELVQFYNMLDEAFTVEALKNLLSENNIG